MDRKLLGRRINKARKEQGLTSEELSDMCNINSTYLRQIEAGSRTPSLPLFVSLCKCLKTSPSYLLAEVLPCCEIQEMDALLSLWQQATPRQLKMISAIVKSALESFEE